MGDYQVSHYLSRHMIWPLKTVVIHVEQPLVLWPLLWTPVQSHPCSRSLSIPSQKGSRQTKNEIKGRIEILSLQDRKRPGSVKAEVDVILVDVRRRRMTDAAYAMSTGQTLFRHFRG